MGGDDEDMVMDLMAAKMVIERMGGDDEGMVIHLLCRRRW